MQVGNVTFEPRDVYQLLEKYGELLRENIEKDREIRELKRTIEEIVAPPDLCDHGS